LDISKDIVSYFKFLVNDISKKIYSESQKRNNDW